MLSDGEAWARKREMEELAAVMNLMMKSRPADWELGVSRVESSGS